MEDEERTQLRDLNFFPKVRNFPRVIMHLTTFILIRPNDRLKISFAPLLALVSFQSALAFDPQALRDENRVGSVENPLRDHKGKFARPKRGEGPVGAQVRNIF